MQSCKCSRCNTLLRKIFYDIGGSVIVKTLNCPSCYINITDDNYLRKCVKILGYRSK